MLTPFPIVAMILAGCDGKGSEGPSDTSTIDTVADGLAEVASDTVEDSPADVVDDDGSDAACAGDGEIETPCASDCDCAGELVCRGYPGELACAVGCIASAACTPALVGCDTTYCDLNVGACRCVCDVDGDCDGGHCHLGWCVGCATDDHCALLDCTVGVPRCDLDTEMCVCGGACGDGHCDPDEAGASSCPADCPSPCIEGEVMGWPCQEGGLVTFCTCTAGAFECVDDPASLCPAATACERAGGECTTSDGYCEGTLSADPMECSGDSPVCCVPGSCTGAGRQYYPYFGVCCPGLRALPSLEPTEDYMTGTGCPICMASCWILTCAPCGDGACQPHFEENPCNCPEDCPRPPYEIGCSSYDEECGITYCRQEGTACRQLTPGCEAGACVVAEELHEGRICSPVTRRCEI